ncbi:MAG TPA: SHOCT domain-containing protein, partial [Methylophilaceae bacterium]|nr:SHOCT domain-containing protein [Methylophilaceae bacterium]
ILRENYQSSNQQITAKTEITTAPTNPEHQTQVATSQTQSPGSHEQELKELKQLYAQGLITQEVYVERQKAILGSK